MWQAIVSGVLFLVVIAVSRMAIAGQGQVMAARELEGITVRSAWFSSGTVTLKNGEYRAPTAPGAATETVLRLTDWRAFGPVNGKDAVAIVLVTDPGGSGTFYDLALLEMRTGGWVYADSVLLGDRVKVHSVGIKDNAIIVSMTVHGQGDAMCCPSREVTRRFMVQEGRLVEEKEGRSGMQDSGIVGPVWQWVRTRYNNDTALTPPADTAGYTLLLNPNGTVDVRGDCNRAGGSFTVNGSKISITITHKTLAACPEGSMEDSFLRDLNRTDGFLLKNGMLFLDLKLDTGTMEFRKK
jgi:heat shock protein HslJ